MTNRNNRHPAADAPIPGNATPDAMTSAHSREPKLRQPHERDESADNGEIGTDNRTDQPQRTRQGHEDVERGVVDTERRGVPTDVPGSRENSP